MIIRCSKNNRRPGYTLIEILLSASIAIILLSGVYVAMRVQLRSAQESRDAVEQGMLVRSLIARIANDISGNLCAAPAPATSGSSSGGSATGGSTTPSTGGAASAPSSGSGASGSSRPASTSTGPAVVFNLGVQGTTSQVVLYVSRPIRPPNVLAGEAADAELPPGVCDLRRITYWFIAGSGLARQEVRLVTAEDAMSVLPPDVPDAESLVIAPEVKNLTFRFFDGTDWRDDWDGTAAGADGTTPLGPPLAVSIEMAVTMPGSTTDRQVRHVVAIQSANGIASSTSGSTGSSR